MVFMEAAQPFLSMFHNARRASRALAIIPDSAIMALLHDIATMLAQQQEYILAANRHDLEQMFPDNPKYDRLKLTPERLEAIAADMRNVAGLPSPLGKKLEERTLANGLHLRKISVPLGVVGVIYEARPNVTADVVGICLKSGNACVLKGGSDAQASNEAIMRGIHEVLRQHPVDPAVVQLLPPGREAAEALFQATGFVDVIIPRGSQSLIDTVRRSSRVPVIETGAGIVHCYFDRSGDAQMGKNVIFNAKTRRVSVCNALDTLILHRERLYDLPELVAALKAKNVILYADSEAFTVLQGFYPLDLLKLAQNEHFGTEFLDYKMSIKTVNNLDEALEHIAQYSSRHSESIIADDPEILDRFFASVDAAVVYANVSTAFTDGAQFGMGAEIGISTQKLHARGPMSLPELTSYKWLVVGQGQVRPD